MRLDWAGGVIKRDAIDFVDQDDDAIFDNTTPTNV